jgi:hypothetical protein
LSLNLTHLVEEEEKEEEEEEEDVDNVVSTQTN